jgi:aminoglycoside 3-N-acetyltransferase
VKSHYSKSDLVAAFRFLGLKRGQVVFCHSNIGYFGIPSEGNNRETANRVVLEAFQEVLDEDGTLVVPTFTYSFARREIFNPQSTPSTSGPWTEFVRKQPGAYRSADPMFSVVALGARAAELVKNVSAECFGVDSFWERFLRAEGVICNLNVWILSTFIHFVERRYGAPYRYNKVFTGTLQEDGELRKTSVLFYCQDPTNPHTRVATAAFDELALKAGVAKKTSVGRGHVSLMSARDMAGLIEETLPKRPWFLTQAEEYGVTPRLDHEASQFGADLTGSAKIEEIVEALRSLPRDLVSGGCDAAFDLLAKQIRMKVHCYPTGMSAGPWIVPERWECIEAKIETLDGRVVFSSIDNPQQVLSNSLPFEGIVSRTELLEHCFRTRTGRYYDRDWGFCLPAALQRTLLDERYRVSIRTEFSFGSLKVGEVFHQGNSDQCVLLCAYLCEPGAGADESVAVAVGIEVMRRMMKNRNRYSYRLLIVPGRIGATCWLSHNELRIQTLLNLPVIESPDSAKRINLEIDWCDTEGAVQKILGWIEDIEAEAITGLRRIQPVPVTCFDPDNFLWQEINEACVQNGFQ